MPAEGCFPLSPAIRRLYSPEVRENIDPANRCLRNPPPRLRLFERASSRSRESNGGLETSLLRGKPVRKPGTQSYRSNGKCL